MTDPTQQGRRIAPEGIVGRARQGGHAGDGAAAFLFCDEVVMQVCMMVAAAAGDGAHLRAGVFMVPLEQALHTCQAFAPALLPVSRTRRQRSP